MAARLRLGIRWRQPASGSLLRYRVNSVARNCAMESPRPALAAGKELRCSSRIRIEMAGQRVKVFVPGFQPSDGGERRISKWGSVESIARDALALGPHIVSAQLAQGIAHKFGGNSLAPGHVEIRVVQRLGNSGCECGGFFDGRLIQRAA